MVIFSKKGGGFPFQGLLLLTVRGIRVELTRPYGHYLLRVARLPIPPLALIGTAKIQKNFFTQRRISLFSTFSQMEKSVSKTEAVQETSIEMSLRSGSFHE